MALCGAKVVALDASCSYNSGAVKIGAQFSQLPDGTNHVDTMQMNGVSKHLLVTTRNSNYQKVT